MKRALQVVYNMDICGGIQSFIMNVYRKIDRNKIQFDFLIFEHSCNSYEEEIKKLGGNIYIVPGRKQGIIKNKNALNEFFTLHKYDVVHYHSDSLSNIEPLVAAKRNRVRTRIMHCHSTNIISNNKIYYLLHKYNKTRISKIATHFFACSNDAKQWAYAKTKIESKAKVIYNGIDFSKYQKNIKEDNKTRKELKIGKDNFVVCHTGRFVKVKNYDFILKIFSKVLERNNKSILILIGDGELFNEIQNKIKNMNLQNNIKMLGKRNDVNKILRVSDSFVYPSLYEGFGMSVLEAEAVGIPCNISNNIPDDVVINDNVIKISLNENAERWAELVLNNNKRCSNKSLINKKFDIDSTVDELMKYYLM